DLESFMTTASLTQASTSSPLPHKLVFTSLFMRMFKYELG
ncbi:26816_t:CDS:1, partial [Gigaspora margarita]